MTGSERRLLFDLTVGRIDFAVNGVYRLVVWLIG
jgi:hypothetical protein